MDKKNSIKSNISEKFDINKSYLDLSSYSKTNYEKQRSINNTNEVFDFFTNISNNQKDLNKKYEQLFILIKKFGKEIKYLLKKNDEYNNILTDTDDYIKKIKNKLCPTSYNKFENIESEIYKDLNNIDVIAKLITYILKEIEKNNKNFNEHYNKLEDLKKYIENKDVTNIERKLTLKNKELIRKFTDNINSLKDQDLNNKIKEDFNIFKSDLKRIYSHLLYFILKYINYVKKYRLQKFYFFIWFYYIKRKKEALNKINKILCKKKQNILSYALSKLKNNSYEENLIEKILSILSKSNIENDMNNIEDINRENNEINSKQMYTNLKSISKSKMSILSDINNNKIKRENSFNKNTKLINKSETSNTYNEENYNNSYMINGKNDTKNNIIDKKIYDIKKYVDKYINDLDNKADKKNLDILYKSIKKLHDELNELKNIIELNKKTNNDLLYNNETKKNSYIQKNSKLFEKYLKNTFNTNNYMNTMERTLSEYLLNNTKKNSIFDNSHVKSLLRKKDEKERIIKNEKKKNSEDILHEKIKNDIEKWKSNNENLKYIDSFDKITSNNYNNTYIDNNKKFINLKEEKNKNNEYNFNEKNDESYINNPNISNYEKCNKKQDDNYENDKYNNYKNNKYDKYNENYKNDKYDDNYKNDKYNENYKNDKYDDNYNNDKYDDNYKNNKYNENYRNDNYKNNKYNENYKNDKSYDENINLILRTGGGFRKLSEQDKNRYLEKMNYLNENNLLTYETNLNIKIKTPGIIRNIHSNNQNGFKKEKRYRSLSKIPNMY